MITPLDPCPANAEWRVVPFNDHYEISEFGHARRNMKCGHWSKEKILRASMNARYLAYRIHSATRKTLNPIHRIVALTFLPAPDLPERNQVAHADGNKFNCHFTNLRWATAEENNLDKHVHGTTLWGSSINTAKLTPEQVQEIRKSPLPSRKIAAQYGVEKTTILRIRRGKTWVRLANDADQPGVAA